MCKETALRFRIERIGDNTKTATYKWANAQLKAGNAALYAAAHTAISRFGPGKALTAWAVAQYRKDGRLPSNTDAGIAIDNGDVGRWIDSKNPKKPDRVEYPDRDEGSRKPKAWKEIGDRNRARRAELDKLKGYSAQNRALEAQIEAQLEGFKSA